MAEGRLRRQPAPAGRRTHQPRPRRRSRRAGTRSPARSSAPPAPASPACASPTRASRRSWRACCALALRPAGFTSRDLRHLPRTPARETPRGHDRRPDQLRPAQAPRPPDHRAHPAQPQLPGHRRRPVHALFLTRLTSGSSSPASPSSPAPARPRHAAPRRRPRLPGRHRRPRPPRRPRRLKHCPEGERPDKQNLTRSWRLWSLKLPKRGRRRDHLHCLVGPRGGVGGPRNWPRGIALGVGGLAGADAGARCPGPPPDRNLGDRRRRPVPGVRPGPATARFHGRPSQHLAGRRGAGQRRRADPSRTAEMDNPRVSPGRTVSPRPAGRAPPPGRQDGRRPGSMCRRLDQIVRAARIAARGRVARSARRAQQ